MIVVAGGSGRLGTRVVNLLRQRGEEVRVLTRDKSRAAHLAGIGVEIVEGDVRDAAAARRAMAGVRTAVSAIQGFAGTKDGSPATIDRDGNHNLILAASEAAVEHIQHELIARKQAGQFSMGDLKPGEKVVDIGSGAGFDSILAAQMVGPTGHVTGVDMTPEMRDKARSNAALVGLGNVEFVDGLAEQLPLPDSSVDVVISNGVINLCPDKLAVYKEVHRILAPRGRLQIADVVVQEPLPDDAVADIDLWTG